VLAFGGHPDNLEVVMGGTQKLARAVRTVHPVRLSRDDQPTRHEVRGVRRDQAVTAADIIRVERTILTRHGRLTQDMIEAASAIPDRSTHVQATVFTTQGNGVRPDHRSVTGRVCKSRFG
jgi:LmbE family N-acetylglucosaminyl deacetylase